MAHEPKRAPGVPGTSAEPIKRAEDIRVPASWLLESDHLELADRIDRLAGDDELVTLLALGGYKAVTGRTSPPNSLAMDSQSSAVGCTPA
jgi:hypothetical protein